jgi:hypothetical protein
VQSDWRSDIGMTVLPSASQLPRHLSWLVVVYCLASVAHFTHNAEYIALYPNMPAWLGREDVYVAWLAVSAVGVAGALMWTLGWRVAALLALATYGALGLAGLAHYSLALCSEHSLVMNLTIWFEAITGLTLAVAAVRHIVRSRVARRRADV